MKEISWEPRVRPGYTRPGLPPGSSYAATSSEGIDDLTQDTATTGNVEPIGTRAYGNIDRTGDVDYFKIVLVSGYSYRIEVKGDVDAALGGTLTDPHVELRDSNGNALSESSSEILLAGGDNTDSSQVADDDSGEGFNPLLRVKINSTARYFIAVTGTYNNPHRHLHGASDDYRPPGAVPTRGLSPDRIRKQPETTCRTQSRPLGTSSPTVPTLQGQSASTDTDTDTDYFKVDLVAGQSYHNRLQGQRARRPRRNLGHPPLRIAW